MRRVLAVWILLSAGLMTACGGGGGTTPAVVDNSGDTGDGSGTGATGGSVFVVGSAAALPAGATRVAQLTDVPWASLPAGSTVIVSAGSFAGPVTVTAQGSASAPIVVRADDVAHPPVLSNSMDFQQAAWVQVSGLVVQSPTYAGFVIRLGSHHITVADSVVRAAPMGVNITDGAGTGHAILRNRIEDSATNGIGVDGINADTADRTLIQHNTVLRSGHHGLEIRGSNYQIEHNEVTLSGQTIGGTSGIHLYSRSADDNTGDGNLVRYNRSHGNLDRLAHDGNGIQVDQWCDGNTVAFNLAWDNDGAGLAVYDGNANAVYANTLRGNGLDGGGTHGVRAELILNGQGLAGRPASNQLDDNLVVATQAGVVAVYVDARAVAQGSNRVGANWLYHAAGGHLLNWNDQLLLATAAQVDAATGTSGNLSTAPAFANASQPLADGLRLTRFPGATGRALSGQTDLLGQAWQSGWASVGAYFMAP
jgi:hypothetical protein